ncbi:MAG: DNA-directed RNA polymerase subunit omega [Clostridiaceae bacterium]|nr:DNA-directed RNA polymerase subunit omega [Clostridiaceae bacterium]
MIYPPISSMLKKVDSRYTLVILAAKRARALTNGEPQLINIDSTKDVTIAMHEINEGKVTYHRIQKQAPTKENLVETSLNTNEE